MWLTDCSVLDVLTGGVRPSASVSVDNGRIGQIVDGPPPVGADAVHSVDGAMLMPGLISCHTHLSIYFPLPETDENENPALTAFRSAKRATDALHAGVTTIRCVHELHQVDLVLRQAVARGWFDAPRILGGGRAITTSNGHGRGTGARYASGGAEFFAEAMAELEAGADHVKIFITGGLARGNERLDSCEMTNEELRGVVAAADKHDRYVVAHAGGSAAIQSALAAGVRCFEHAYELDEGTAAKLAAAGAFVTPTLCVTHGLDWRRRNNFPEASITHAAAAAPGHLESIGRAVAAGVKLVNGTDFPPGAEIEGTSVAVFEMGLMVKAGLSPIEAIRSATSTATELLGIADEVGTLTPGKAADIIAVRGDPTADIDAMRDITFVMQGGRVVRSSGGAA